MADREDNIFDLDNRIRDLEKRIETTNLENKTWSKNPDDLKEICKQIRQNIDADYNRVMGMIRRIENNGHRPKRKKIYVSSPTLKFPTLREVQHEKRKRRHARIDKIERVVRTHKKDSGKQVVLEYKKVKWKILPPGKWSMADIKGYYFEYAKRFPSEKMDLSRLEIIEKLNPFECLLGENENYGYVAYRFKYTPKVVLDKPIFGNAIYVIYEEWKKLIKLTKSELLEDHSGKLRRMYHVRDWFGRLQKDLRD